MRGRALWIYIPDTNPRPANSSASPCALATPASTSDCTSPSQVIELSVSSSGKPMLRRPSWRGWKTKRWAKRLYGLTYEPLMADRGAERFISSLPAIPASPSVSQGSDAAQPILGTCGPKSPALSRRSGRLGSSARMSRVTSIWDLPTSRRTLRGWATEQRRACSRRLKLARATGVTASSFWPTPTAKDSGHFPDLSIEAGTIMIKKDSTIIGQSGGQVPLQNAARTWTVIWMVLMAVGWRPSSCRSSLPVRVNLAHGATSWLSGLISNPRFYEAMMGWPIGWTDPEAQVTAFAAWLRQSRGQFSRLLSSPMHREGDDA